MGSPSHGIRRGISSLRLRAPCKRCRGLALSLKGRARIREIGGVLALEVAPAPIGGSVGGHDDGRVGGRSTVAVPSTPAFPGPKSSRFALTLVGAFPDRGLSRAEFLPIAGRYRDTRLACTACYIELVGKSAIIGWLALTKPCERGPAASDGRTQSSQPKSIEAAVVSGSICAPTAPALDPTDERGMETEHALGTAAPAMKCVDSAGPIRPPRQPPTLPPRCSTCCAFAESSCMIAAFEAGWAWGSFTRTSANRSIMRYASDFGRPRGRRSRSMIVPSFWQGHRLGGLDRRCLVPLAVGLVGLAFGLLLGQYQQFLACTPNAEPSCPVDDLPRVRAAFNALSLQTEVLAGIILVYGVSFASDWVRCQYRAAGSWATHWAWSVTALAWLAWLVLGSGTNATTRPLNSTHMLAGIAIAGVLFLFGTGAGARWRQSPAHRTRLGVVLLLAIVAAFVVTDMIENEEQAADIASMAAAFANVHLKEPNGTARVFTYWVSGARESWLYILQQSSFWLLAIWAYLLSYWTTDNLSAFFSGCLAYIPPRLHEIGSGARRRLTRWSGSALGHAPWLISMGWMFVPDVRLLVAVFALFVVISPTLTHWLEPQWSAAAPLAARVIMLAAAYLALLIPALIYAVALGQGQRGGVAVRTTDRQRIASSTRPTLLLLLVVGGLLTGNSYLLLYQGGLPAAVGLTGLLGQGADADTRAFMVLVFAAIVVQAYLLIELPYNLGQSRFKASEVRRTSAELRAAADELAAYLISVRDGAAADSREPTALALAQFELDRRMARHALAEERAQDVQRIPVHTFKSLADLLSKGAKSALLSLLAALLKEGNVGGGDALMQLVKSLTG